MSLQHVHPLAINDLSMVKVKKICMPEPFKGGKKIKNLGFCVEVN